MQRKKKAPAETTNHNGRAKVQTESTSTKFTTCATVFGAALLAFPFVDGLTNMPCLSYIGLAAIAAVASITALSISENARCSR